MADHRGRAAKGSVFCVAVMTCRTIGAPVESSVLSAWRSARPAFDNEVKTFECNLQNYHREVLKTVEALKSDFEEKLIKEYLPKWVEHPPANFARYNLASAPGNLEKELRVVIKRLSSEAISFGTPIVRVIYKNIAPESVTDPNFLEPLKKNMEGRGVPRTVIESLFASGDAAPASRTVAPHLL